MRIIADHIRASVMITGDPRGIAPSNTDQGYVVRRLIRNALIGIQELNLEEGSILKIAEVVISQMSFGYKELDKNKDFIFKCLDHEEHRLGKAIAKAMPLLNKEAIRAKEANEKFSGDVAFDLHQTHGLDILMQLQETKKQGVLIDVNRFNEKQLNHHQASRTASAGKFKGGLADDSENTKKLHTAAHLVLVALKRVLGDHVEQKGSNINSERLRFDFPHSEKMTPEQITEVENIVNEQINKKLPIVCEEMALDKARESGASGIFNDRYGNKVKVYTIGDPSTDSGQVFSKEICGGPHAENTGELGVFKIIKEQSSSSGVRRIKAILK